MGFLEKLGIGAEAATIDWEMTPVDTFGMFESWGGKERIRNKKERFYYFYIDNWSQPARVHLMQRGIKHARILARIKAPQDLVDRCVASQGRAVMDKTYAIDEPLRRWLQDNIVDTDGVSWIVPLPAPERRDVFEAGLPLWREARPLLPRVSVRQQATVVDEPMIDRAVRGLRLLERRRNPVGGFRCYLVDNEDGLTVSEVVSGLMWQRGGSDITSIRGARAYVAELNRQGFAGCDDWRLPTIDEALTVIAHEKSGDGLFLHGCFSAAQPYIFTADQRRPAGYWFVDFAQAVVFWSSGFNPGGFARACRNLQA